MSTLSDAPVPYGTPRGKPAVASRADGAEDARVLLEHLGLIDPSTPPPAWRRANKPKGAPT